MKDTERKNRLKGVVISPKTPISKAIRVLDRAGTGVLLLCEKDGSLAGILTDGDIRRAILRKVSFDKPCLEIAGRDPLTASPGINQTEALRLMDKGRRYIVNQLPVVDGNGRVVDLLLRRDIVKEDSLLLSAVVMAGGFGKRLSPLTDEVPKPMLPVGEKPLMQHIIDQLKQAGIGKVSISTHYQSEKIRDHFGDGQNFGIDIRYISEERPLGTAGALGLMDRSEEPLLVINGDILTRVDFRAMLDFHRKQEAYLTIGVRQYDLQVPYGVVESEGPIVLEIREKPQIQLFVNSGIYLLEPDIQNHIPAGEYLNMPDLIDRLLKKGQKVVNFPIVEYWLDIGRQEEYEKAQEDLTNRSLET
jgi:dTDP-glucose pyrophosphorylase/CBS domain-containing protein